MLIYAVFALGLNVLVGYAGLVTLGHAGLFGIAAYAGAMLINDGHGHLVAIVGALAVTLWRRRRSSRCWRCAAPASALS